MATLSAPHILYITPNGASVQQIEEIVKGLFKKYRWTGTYQINSNRYKTKNAVYLQLSSKIANLILGLNEDGSERVDVKIDPDYQSPAIPLIEELASALEGMTDPEMIEMIREEISLEYQPKKIYQPLAPLVDVPGFTLSDGSSNRLEIGRAYTKLVDTDQYERNYLVLNITESGRPALLPSTILATYFSVYSTDRNYPKFKRQSLPIGKDRKTKEVIAIQFSPLNHDAEFATLMFDDVTIPYNGKSYSLRAYFAKKDQAKLLMKGIWNY